jgi:hypothetical protein
MHAIRIALLLTVVGACGGNVDDDPSDTADPVPGAISPMVRDTTEGRPSAGNASVSPKPAPPKPDPLPPRLRPSDSTEDAPDSTNRPPR